MLESKKNQSDEEVDSEKDVDYIPDDHHAEVDLDDRKGNNQGVYFFNILVWQNVRTVVYLFRIWTSRNVVE